VPKASLTAPPRGAAAPARNRPAGTRRRSGTRAPPWPSACQTGARLLVARPRNTDRQVT